MRMERGQDRGIDLCAKSSGCCGPVAPEASSELTPKLSERAVY